MLDNPTYGAEELPNALLLELGLPPKLVSMVLPIVAVELTLRATPNAANGTPPTVALPIPPAVKLNARSSVPEVMTSESPDMFTGACQLILLRQLNRWQSALNSNLTLTLNRSGRGD